MSSDHFHNAVDIPQPGNYPTYSCLDGVVHTLVNNGSNSYIRIRSKINGKWKHITYYHIVPSSSLSVGDSVKAGVTKIGTVYSSSGHVHMIERELVY